MRTRRRNKRSAGGAQSFGAPKGQVARTGENGTCEDEVLAGYDVYEGLSVPMVAPWKGNRRLLIGWINHGYGWGGWLCFRELVQYPDGHLGTKWVPEIPMPTPVKTYKVKPGEAFSLAFTGTGDAFAFTLDGAKRKAWFATKQADGTYGQVPTLGEMAVAHSNATRLGPVHGAPHKWYNLSDVQEVCL